MIDKEEGETVEKGAMPMVVKNLRKN